jgi:hypothetical protein
LTHEKKEKQTTPDWCGHGIFHPPLTPQPKSEKLSPIQNNQKNFKKNKMAGENWQFEKKKNKKFPTFKNKKISSSPS